MSRADLCHSLLARGDTVSIQCGRLVIQPASGNPVPPEWLAEHGESITKAILAACERYGFRYLKHSTGRFGGGRYPGVALQLVELLTGEQVCAVFNAKLNRERTTRAGGKGEPLPPGQFRIGDGHALWKLWRACGLPEPRRRSELYEVMHKLDGVLLQGDKRERAQSKLIATSVTVLNIGTDQIRSAFGIGYARQLVGKESASARQLVGKSSATVVGKEIAKTLVPSCLEANSNRVFSEPRNKQEVIKEARKQETPTYASASVEIVSTGDPECDEWLADYNRRDAEILAAENLSPDPAVRLAGYLAEYHLLAAEQVK